MKVSREKVNRIAHWAVMSAALLLPAVVMADTNIDNLTSGVTAIFATAAGVAVTITVFFIGRSLLRRGAVGR